MNQLVERIRPWAPTMLVVGLIATLAESLQERDLTSIVLLLMSVVGAMFVLRANRALTRGEVRAEIATGIRAMVRPEARVPHQDQESTLDIPVLSKEVP